MWRVAEPKLDKPLSTQTLLDLGPLQKLGTNTCSSVSQKTFTFAVGAPWEPGDPMGIRGLLFFVLGAVTFPTTPNSPSNPQHRTDLVNKNKTQNKQTNNFPQLFFHIFTCTQGRNGKGHDMARHLACVSGKARITKTNPVLRRFTSACRDEVREAGGTKSHGEQCLS